MKGSILGAWNGPSTGPDGIAFTITSHIFLRVAKCRERRSYCDVCTFWSRHVGREGIPLSLRNESDASGTPWHSEPVEVSSVTSTWHMIRTYEALRPRSCDAEAGLFRREAWLQWLWDLGQLSCYRTEDYPFLKQQEDARQNVPW